MAGELQSYEKTGLITSPGRYFFAAGPLTLPYPDELRMPDGTPEVQNIFGLVPNIELPLAQGLIEDFPNLKIITGTPRYDDKSGVPIGYSSLEYDDWHRNSGFLTDMTDRFWISWFTQRNSSHCFRLLLTDKGKLELVKNRVSHLESINNGSIKMDLDQSRKEKEDERGPYWRGYMNVKGDRPSVFMDKALERINQIFTDSETPIWKTVAA